MGFSFAGHLMINGDKKPSVAEFKRPKGRRSVCRPLHELHISLYSRILWMPLNTIVRLKIHLNDKTTWMLRKKHTYLLAVALFLNTGCICTSLKKIEMQRWLRFLFFYLLVQHLFSSAQLHSGATNTS